VFTGAGIGHGGWHQDLQCRIEVGLENASHAAFTMNSVRSRTFSAQQATRTVPLIARRSPCRRRMSNPSRSRSGTHHPPSDARAFGMCFAAAVGESLLEMQRTVSSITSARVRSARSWLRCGSSRRDCGADGVQITPPHRGCARRAGPATRAVPRCGAIFLPVDHLLRGRRRRSSSGWDHTALVVVGRRQRRLSALISTPRVTRDGSWLRFTPGARASGG